MDFRINVFKFITQVAFSSSVLAFCIFMLATGKAEDDRKTALYWSGLSSTVAYWFPSPNQFDSSPPIESSVVTRRRKPRIRRNKPKD